MTTAPGTTVEVPQGAVIHGQVVPAGQVTAVFTAPDGTPFPVVVRLFQVGAIFGVGVYPTDARGTVLRWHDGPHEDPHVIHWAAPQSPEGH
jgi:hypothetical protein